MMNKRFPGESLEWQKGTAFTLWFVNVLFCDVKHERGENYKESGIFS